MNYLTPESKMFFNKTLSKGAQPKYYADCYYYKVDTEMNEGLKEYIVSLLLASSSLPFSSYVSYEKCVINGRDGCRSLNFLQPGESFLPIGRLHEAVTGKPKLADTLMQLSTAEERLDFILDLVESIGANRNQFREYLRVIVQLDLLIENIDRHEFNYGLIRTVDQSFRTAPIFDNGNCLRDGAACTLCGSFEMQCTAFEFPIIPAFTINRERFIELLTFDNTISCEPAKRLLKNLDEYNFFVR